jgi:hypothetical protein
MKRAAFFLLPLLAACAAPPPDAEPPTSPFLGAIFRPPVAQPSAPASLPPQVLAALPPGVPPSVVTRNADGCYLVTLERMEPPGGYPLRDAAGNRVCDGAVPVPGTTAGVTPVVLPPAPVTTTSLVSPDADGAFGFPSGPPVPTAVLGAPPPPGQEPVALPVPDGSAPFAPGNITPPAPLAPLNPA